MVSAVVLAATGAIILTDAGQILGVSKSTVIGYFRIHGWFMGLAVAAMLGALFLNRRRQMLRGRWMLGFAVVVIGCLLATKFATPYILFPSKQHETTYKTVGEVEGYLAPADHVYVVEHKDVVRAYPQKLIWQNHIFGGDFEGDDIVFTYCVLTNLPVSYVNELNGQPMDLKVLAQTNNNLLLWDTHSGEIIQQITSTCDISKDSLEPLPVVEMSWKAFRDIHPDGTVAFIEFTTPLERVLDAMMPLEDAHGGDDWMFGTVDVSDDRLHSKEKIIGVVDGNEALAFTRDYLAREGLVYADVGGKRLVLAHLPEHDVIVSFDRMREGEVQEVTEVDYHGNTREHGKLDRAFIYNGPMWAVWVHYYPDTQLFQ
jgi:hypothetical protein